MLASLSSQVELDLVETIIWISGYKNVMKSNVFHLQHFCSMFSLNKGFCPINGNKPGLLVGKKE